MLYNIRSVLAKSHGYTFYKREFNQILEVVQDDSSSCTSSSSEDDLDLLLLEFACAPKRVSQACSHIDDLFELECEELSGIVVYMHQYFNVLNACVSGIDFKRVT